MFECVCGQQGGAGVFRVILLPNLRPGKWWCYLRLQRWIGPREAGARRQLGTEQKKPRYGRKGVWECELCVCVFSLCPSHFEADCGQQVLQQRDNDSNPYQYSQHGCGVPWTGENNTLIYTQITNEISISELFLIDIGEIEWRLLLKYPAVLKEISTICNLIIQIFK